MKPNLKIFLGLLVMCACLAFTSRSLTLDTEQSKLTIFGTSSLHDWEEVAEELTGSAEIIHDGKKVTEVKSLFFALPVESLKSGKTAMDKNTYAALKSDEYPTITYKLLTVESINPSVDGMGYIIRTEGKLTLSGKSHIEKFKVYSVVRQDGSVQFKGEVQFPMTKYGVTPPTAIMGTIKTGDDIKIKFSTVYK